jgi:hypothetical protein
MSKQPKTIRAEIEMRRNTLTAHRDQYRRSAYEAEIQAEAVKIQPHVSDEERTELVKELTEKMENSLAAADRMDELLAELSRPAAK